MATKSELEPVYRATTYKVFLPGGGLDLRIDQAHAGLAAWLAEEGYSSWAILTAFNPAGEARGEADNRERQSALEVALLETGREPYAGENVADAGDWPVEESCFVPGMDAAAALELAARFGQNAIVFGEADGLPRLLWVEHKE